MAIYKPDYEKFLQTKRGEHPEWAREQREGFLRLWNRQLDVVEQITYAEASDARKSYPYDVNFF